METLGFDETSSWMLYDENLQRFFSFLENNITHENILTSQEVEIANDLESRNALLLEESCNEIISELSQKFDGIFNENIDNEITALEREIRDLRKAEEMYKEVNLEIKQNLEAVQPRISNIEMKIIDLETVEKQAQEKCIALGTKLQEAQKENKKLSNEAEDCFSRMVRVIFQID